MKRLFALEFHRLFKQKSAWTMWIIIFLMGGLNVFFAYVSRYESGIRPGEYIYFSTARSILEGSFSLGSIQMVIVGILASLFIAQDIAQGTIRNKIIAGFSKFEIYFVQMVMSVVLTFIGLGLFQLLPSIFSPLITFPTSNDGTNTFANFMITMSFGYMLVTVGVLLTSFISMHAKNTATAIIFTILIFVLGPGLTILLKSIIEGIRFINMDQFADPETIQAIRDEINAVFEFVYFYQLNRLIGTGSIADLFNGFQKINFFNEEFIPYIWKTIVTNVALIGLIVGLGGYAFHRSDLK
jgi:hypothetical protein